MPPRNAHPAPGRVLAVLAFGVFVAADDLTVVSTMLRQIVFDLGIALPDGLDQAAWIVNAYLIAYVVVMPFIGRISDLIGRKTVYLSALVLFLAGSVWTPFAPDLPTFLASRVITAVGGGAMVPVSLAIIGDIYPTQRRATALGTLGAVDTAGWVWGPLYGALLVRFLSWRWQFYLNIPLALIGIAAAWLVLRDLPQPTTRKPVDWPGAALLTVALLTLNLGLLGAGDVGAAGGFAALEPQPALTWPYYAAAALALTGFVAWQRRLAQQGGAPLVDMGLFGRTNFSPAVLINFLIGSALIIAMVNAPLIVNVLEGSDVGGAALLSGQLLSAMTGSMALLAYVGGRLSDRVGYRLPTLLGVLVAAGGLLIMGLSWNLDVTYGQMAWQLAWLGCGFGLVMAPVSAAVIDAAPDDQRGIASSLVIVVRLIGMSVGLSALTSWGLRRFDVLRTQVTLPPLTDPNYGSALVTALTGTTVRVLAETFLLAAAALAVALLAAAWLRRAR